MALLLIVSILALPLEGSTKTQVTTHFVPFLFGVRNFLGDPTSEGSNEIITLEISPDLLSRKLSIRDIRISIDETTSNRLTLIEVEAVLQVARAEGKAVITVPVASPNFLVIPGTYEVTARAIFEDGSTETLSITEEKSSPDGKIYIASGDYIVAKKRLKFANRVIELQLEATEKVIEELQKADPSLYKPDSNNTVPLRTGTIEIWRNLLSTYQRVIKMTSGDENLFFKPGIGPLVFRNGINDYLSLQEKSAYAKDDSGLSSNLLRLMINDIATSLDRTNAMLLKIRMGLTSGDYKERERELLHQKELLSDLYLKVQKIWIEIPGFPGRWWDPIGETTSPPVIIAP